MNYSLSIEMNGTNETVPDWVVPDVNETVPDWAVPDAHLDKLLGSALLLCMVFGLPGNLISLSYFLSKTRCDLATFLYRAICCVDICTGLLPLPVIISLFSLRSPRWFNNHSFCVCWAIVFTFVQQISIFLVLLLSVTRTVNLVRPFFPVSKRTVGYCLLGFILFRVSHEACFNFLPGYFEIKYQYSRGTVYCYYYVGHPWAIVDEIISSVFIAVVPVVITISFIVCLTHVLKRQEGRDDDKARKRVTLTMSLFTALSLMCNTPLFINYLVYIVDCNIIEYVYPSDIYKNKFMYSYSWPITEIYFMSLNSALNPLLYFWRMERLHAWILKRFQFIKVSNECVLL